MDIEKYKAKSGTFEAVWTLEIQTIAEEVDKTLDAIMAVHPLNYGRYQRNASVTAIGLETSQPEPGTTTDTHVENFVPGGTETYPMVEIKVSIERDYAVLERVMDAILDVHMYEQPVILLRENWASRASYDPNRNNPNRWWNNGRGLSNKVESISDALNAYAPEQSS